MTPIVPKLTLLLGPAGCGKTHRCIDGFEKSLRQSKAPLRDDSLFILPTAEHRARTVDLVLRQGHPGFFHRRITTFDRALKEFLKLGGFDFATDASRRAILRDVIRETKLQYFGQAAETSGFLELLGKNIVELKEFLVTPEELSRRLEPLQKQFPEFKLKYEDFIALYQKYEDELHHRNLIDQRDSLKLLEEGLKREEFLPPQLKRVWIDGFSDFSKLQLAFIEFLARHADQVTVSLTIVDDPRRRSLFSIPTESQQALEDLGFKPQWISGDNARTHKTMLQHLNQHLFSETKVRTIGVDTSVQIFEATGLVGEVEMIAREIKRLLRENQYNFSDVALIFRQTGSYESIVTSVCAKYEIPIEIHERRRLRTNPVARTLVSFFKILMKDWTREDLFNFLKSNFVSVDYELVCELELRALQKGIIRDRKYWLENFDPQVLQDIATFEDSFRAIKSVGPFTAWVKVVMDHFGLLKFSEGTEAKAREEREAAKRILLLLDELKRKRRHQKAGTPESFAEELLSLIEVDLFSVHERDQNRVQIYNVSVARQKEYKAVFLVGLLEKKFPIQVKEDPILSDVERRALNEQGEVLRERLPRQAFERYLFYLACTRARNQLILTYPRFDLEGKEALPSFYVDEVKRLFSEPILTRSQAISEVLPRWNEIGIKSEAEERVVYDLWQAPEMNPPQVNSAFLVSFYRRFLEEQRFVDLTQKLLQPRRGEITSGRIKPFFVAKDNVWSPTAIEEYAECSYRYFANHLLHLENQSEGIDLRQVGSMLHEVLEHFFTWFRDEQKGSVSLAAATDFCKKHLQELWDADPLSGDRWHRIALKRKEMEEMLRHLLELELVKKKPPLLGLTPRHFELKFGFSPTKDDYLNVGGVLMRGVIDRIDVDPDETYALVIDYKTGKTFHASTLLNKTGIQLPVYLMAIKQKLGLEVLGAHLYSLSKGASTGFHHKRYLDQLGIKTRKGVQLDQEAFQVLLDNTARNVTQFVDSIKQGEIAVRPRDCASYCPYSAVCRIEKWRLEHIYMEIAEEDKRATERAIEVHS